MEGGENGGTLTLKKLDLFPVVELLTKVMLSKRDIQSKTQKRKKKKEKRSVSLLPNKKEKRQKI